jgi:hypothetical protein
MYLKRSLLFTLMVSGWILAQSVGTTTPKTAVAKKQSQQRRQQSPQFHQERSRLRRSNNTSRRSHQRLLAVSQRPGCRPVV